MKVISRGESKFWLWFSTKGSIQGGKQAAKRDNTRDCGTCCKRSTNRPNLNRERRNPPRKTPPGKRKRPVLQAIKTKTGCKRIATICKFVATWKNFRRHPPRGRRSRFAFASPGCSVEKPDGVTITPPDPDFANGGPVHQRGETLPSPE